MKQCRKCKELLDLSEFYKKTESKDGYKTSCKKCDKKTRHSQNKPCLNCGKMCWSKKKILCIKCTAKKHDEKRLSQTIGDKEYSKHKYAKYSYIRWHAKKIAKEAGWKSCARCGYSKHIEIAHKKAISSFDKNTLLIEINSLDNLIPLCPNCHWEFDNLKIEKPLEVLEDEQESFKLQKPDRYRTGGL